MASLIITQERCDKRKYLKSQQEGKDLSGSMEYCAFCEYTQNGKCTIEQDRRMELLACARAYERHCHKDKIKKTTPPKTCNCQEHLKQYGVITNNNIHPKYKCPNCGNVVCCEPTPIDWNTAFRGGI